MTNFNVAAGTSGLADALITHGGLNFFDEITYSSDPGTNRRVTYLTKSGTTITIGENWDGGSLTAPVARIDSTELNDLDNSGQNTRYFGYGSETDNAIVLYGYYNNQYISSGYYNRPLVICNSKNGGGCVITPVAYSSYAYATSPNFTSGDDRVRTRTFIVSPDGVKTQWYNGWNKNNNSSNVLNTATFWTPDDVAKDVYFCTDRPFAQKEGPFMLEINGESFMSVAYNSILIKTT